MTTCDSFERNNNIRPGYGHSLPRTDVAMPWEEITINIIDPLKIEFPGIGITIIYSLTILDVRTTL